MILLLFIFLIAIYLYQKHYKETKFYPLLTIILSFVLYLLFLVEIGGISAQNYFVSDELGYWKAKINEIDLSKLDRLFWHGLNYFLKNIDIGGIVAIKLISIPLLFFTLYVLWSLFFKDNRIFLLILFYPYFLLLATKNLRDIAILFFVVSTFYLFHKVKFGKVIFLIPIVLLFISRPFIGFLCLIILFIDTYLINYIAFSLWHLKFLIKKKFIPYLLVIFVGLIMFFSIPYVKDRMRGYLFYFKYYTTSKGYEHKLEERGGISTGHIITDYLVGAVRFVVTPIPTSLIKRGLSGGTEDWGLIDDIVRTANQVFYYYFLLYVLINAKAIYFKFRTLSPSAKQLLYVLLAYWPIYTFYGFGGAHQRNKLPFQLAIFLLFLINKNLKLGDIKHN